MSIPVSGEKKKGFIKNEGEMFPGFGTENSGISRFRGEKDRPSGESEKKDDEKGREFPGYRAVKKCMCIYKVMADLSNSESCYFEGCKDEKLSSQSRIQAMKTIPLSLPFHLVPISTTI